MSNDDIQAIGIMLTSMSKDVVEGLSFTGGKHTGQQAKVTDMDGKEIALVHVEVTPYV